MPDQATRMRELAARFSGLRTSPRPRVVTVTSGKGGVGKSTIALNLAVKLGDMGKKVLLIDADANLANLDVMLGMSPRYRLSSVLRGQCAMEDILLAPYPNVRVLPGSSGEVDYPAFDDDAQADLLERVVSMDEQFDAVFIDTAAGLTQEIIGYAELSDETIVVCTPEPTAVMDAYAVMKVFFSGTPDGMVGLVINNSESYEAGKDAADKLHGAVTHFLKKEIALLAIIPHDTRVPESVAKQMPVARAYPASGVSRAFQILAGRFVQRSLYTPAGRAVAL